MLNPPERARKRPKFLAWGLATMVTAGLGVTVLRHVPAHADQTALVLPAPAYNPPDSATSEVAVLSGGCFWGVQGVYEHVKGVIKVYAGYTGGAADTAQYEIVSTGTTGHAESVQITFDPRVISYGQILQIYFTVATDPTELNYQGPDSGTQYRSEIWVANPGQLKIATDYIAQLTAAHAFSQPIVTRVDPLGGFYKAEDYHQDFLVRNPDYPYIVINDIPKVQNLQRLFPSLYAAAPITVFPAS
jgi:peptide-methionine (S)-S-oxide reductase